MRIGHARGAMCRNSTAIENRPAGIKLHTSYAPVTVHACVSLLCLDLDLELFASGNCNRLLDWQCFPDLEILALRRWGLEVMFPWEMPLGIWPILGDGLGHICILCQDWQESSSWAGAFCALIWMLTGQQKHPANKPPDIYSPIKHSTSRGILRMHG